ncbi:unnamed protein product [Paramecium sonneborni]|uniref:Uncharacterized protein n=1 Tax=Paramecium sonneborni TaxID=65129 RepID=A0A8S1P3A6_9CILI|nr:unnamed protein product [Paramecium sonneborni]
MQQLVENDDIYLEPIKKKPKIQEVIKTKQTESNQIIKKIPTAIPIRYVPDLRAQASLLESLKIIENIQPDTMQSSLKSDYTEWTHQDFIFQLSLQSNQIHPDCIERLNQYFRDFNQKCKIYPYMHYVDLKPDKDHIVNTHPPYEYQKDEFIENFMRARVIPIVKPPQKPSIKIKIESK